MRWLLLASFLWAFSFGLIKGLITGIDPFVMGAVRMAMAFAVAWVLGQWFKKRGDQSPSTIWNRPLFWAGFVQLGLMYAPYLLSFRYLQGHEVALFTMTTPLLVVALNQFRERRFSFKIMIAAGVAVAGGVVVAWKGKSLGLGLDAEKLLSGVMLVQLANVLFAVGQDLYVRHASQDLAGQMQTAPDYFGGAFVGGLLCALIAVIGGAELRPFSNQEWLILTWLGVVSSGLGFAIWNFGATKVNYGQLAVASDAKLPMAIVVSLVIFGEQADTVRLLAGVMLLTLASRLARRV